ncbi:branched-chain amino acid ABC transporter permease [Vibrio penaeicida]|uniref:Branched-chain amino acid ABC transporter permease n=1 Tax=Vibrio penaeicida TaxID=104609 RepID=A0AAV5NT81_9VIBR|nr:branched-chain amino acid ABC transporter permease [Vibrio penaeicida]RTZ21824.1 branched-chain amino acid ABC transporter permease [Vibrio penaeicida]GLQ73698.1 branched-chain amino acid ABC transporter permease [Vibrio penaeicida]
MLSMDTHAQVASKFLPSSTFKRPQNRLSLVLFMGLAILFPMVMSEYWVSAVLLPVLILALAGIGLNLLTGYTGQVSLGAGGFMAVGAYATYAFAVHGNIQFLPLTILLGGVVAAIVGFLFGLPSSRLKGFYVMVTSLTLQFFIEWLFTQVAWFYNFGAVPTISLPPMELFGLDINDSSTVRYYFSILVIFGLTWVACNLVKSPVGRNWMSIRDMDTAAGVIGINARKYKTLAFAVSGFYLGIAGALWAFVFLGTASTLSFQIERSFQILFIIIIGGMGSIRGCYIGAAFIFLMPISIDYFVKTFLGGSIDPGILSNLNKVIFGVLIIWFLIKEPEGITRMVSNLAARIRNWPLRI